MLSKQPTRYFYYYYFPIVKVIQVCYTVFLKLLNFTFCYGTGQDQIISKENIKVKSTNIAIIDKGCWPSDASKVNKSMEKNTRGLVGAVERNE